MIKDQIDQLRDKLPRDELDWLQEKLEWLTNFGPESKEEKYNDKRTD